MSLVRQLLKLLARFFGSSLRMGQRGVMLSLASKSSRCVLGNLPFLQKLVAEYYDNGEASFNAMGNDQSLDRRIGAVAGCLVEDAKAQRIPTINLAKNQMEAAQKWQSLLGPF